jgi:malonate-semialdehyde dehydrogenase (acetylating)/methylmalonate-semialdehyde dehydrogenase
MCAILISYSGPVISPAAKDRVLGLIASAEQEGGKIHLDGRHIKVPGYEHGNFVGPVIIEADTTMKCYEYVFVPFAIRTVSRSTASSAKRFSGPSLSF